jgi:hypothetical protein
MNEKLDKILSDLSDLRTEQAVTNERLKHYNGSLDTHIKRTELLEKEVHELWRWKWFVAGGLAVITFSAQIIIKLMVK